ncbi:MAG TPA: hypothetical protein VNI60_06145 [Pyrinomonadaceae bacterium]|nr:hypothetical protein [Pyrinomonadaceae bacterium]
MLPPPNLEQISYKCYTYPQCFIQLAASVAEIVNNPLLIASERAG